MLVSKKTIDEIKEKNKIEDVVRDYVTLGKRGKEYVGKCPFHDDKTPSFSVSPEKQVYYCYGCKKSGDVISFLQLINKNSFIDVVKDLAYKTNIDLEILDPEKQKELNEIKSKKNKILKILAVAGNFYHHQLKINPDKSKILDDRNITPGTIADFKIGYASSKKDGLYQHLLGTLPEFQDVYIETGLFKPNSENITGLTDFFRDRIIIPIKNHQGVIVAFGGRKLSNDDNPKYINTPETLVFNKSEIVFGLNTAKESAKNLRTLNYVIVTEGYFDVIILHQIGFKNAVACLGTAINSKQIKQILKVSDKVFINLDNDKAGVDATEKLIKNLEYEIKNNLVDLKVLDLPQKDACDFINDSSNYIGAYNAYNQALNKAKNWVDWLIDIKLKDKNLLDKTVWRLVFTEFVNIASKLEDLEQIKYIQLFSELLSVYEPELQPNVYNMIIKRLNIANKDNIIDIEKRRQDKEQLENITNISESMILKIYLNFIDYRKLIRCQLLLRNLHFCLDYNRTLWIEINNFEALDDETEEFINNFKFDENLVEKLKIKLGDNSYDEYFNLKDDEIEIIEKSTILVLMLAFNQLERKLIEIKIKQSYELWKECNNDYYFNLYQDFFKQLKKINNELNI